MRSFFTPSLNLVLPRSPLSFLRLSATASMYLLSQSPSGLSGWHATMYRWRFTAESPPAQGQRYYSSSNGCCLFRKPHGPLFFCAPFSPTSTVCTVDTRVCRQQTVSEADSPVQMKSALAWYSGVQILWSRNR